MNLLMQLRKVCDQCVRVVPIVQLFILTSTRAVHTCFLMQNPSHTSLASTSSRPLPSSLLLTRSSGISSRRASGCLYFPYVYFVLVAALIADHCIFYKQWSGMLDLLEDFMALRNIAYARLDGSTTRPRRALDIKLVSAFTDCHKN